MVGPNKFRYVVASGKSAVVGLFLCACAPTFSGTLVSPEGELVVAEEARVNIVRLDGEDNTNPMGSAVIVPVDTDGTFATREELEPGEYLIEALVPGYKLSSQRVNLTEAQSVELTLEPLPEVKASAVGANTTLELGRGPGSARLTPPNL